MTTGFRRIGPPLSLSGAALWFGRNLLEAFIWAFAGAVILVLLLAAHSFPQIAIWVLLIVLVVGGLAWGLSGARRSQSPSAFPPASGVQFHMFGFSVWVARQRRGGPQGDRP